MHEDHPGQRDLKQIAGELKRVFEETKTLRNAPDQSKYMRISGYNSSLFQLSIERSGLPAPIELRIASLAPSGTAQDKYTNALAGCIKPLHSGGWGFEPEEFGAIQNSISVVLLVVFGGTRLILGADAEESNWEQVLKDESRKRNGDTLSCDVVKVSHPGSEGAYHSSVWSEHGIEGLPVALVVPYSSRGLPRPEMVDRLTQLSSKLIITTGSRGSSSARSRFKSNSLSRPDGPKYAQSPGARIGSSVQVNHDGQVVAINDLNA